MTDQRYELHVETVKQLAHKLGVVVRDHLVQALQANGGKAEPIRNFELLNAIAIVAGPILAGAPDQVTEWFIGSVRQSVAEARKGPMVVIPEQGKPS